MNNTGLYSRIKSPTIHIHIWTKCKTLLLLGSITQAPTRVTARSISSLVEQNSHCISERKNQHPNLHCTAGRNVGLHTPCFEPNDKDFFQQSQHPSLIVGCRPKHLITSARAKAQASARAPDTNNIYQSRNTSYSFMEGRFSSFSSDQDGEQWFSNDTNARASMEVGGLSKPSSRAIPHIRRCIGIDMNLTCTGQGTITNERCTSEHVHIR